MGNSISNLDSELNNKLIEYGSTSYHKFNNAKVILKSIMNNFKNNNEYNNDKCVVTIGPKGCGKSTIAKVLYGVKCDYIKIDQYSDSDTIAGPFNTKYDRLKLIDCVGFDPVPINIAKLFIILICKGYYPDSFSLPDERIDNYIKLNNILNLGIFNIVFVPFISPPYYLILKIENETQANDTCFFEYNKPSFNHHIKINEKNSDSSLLINNKDAMNTFFKLFYDDDGQFIDISFDRFLRYKLSSNSKEKSRAMFYGYLIEAISCIPSTDIDNIQNTIVIKNEDQYLNTQYIPNLFNSNELF